MSQLKDDTNMLSGFNVIRDRLLFVLFAIFIFRLGAHVPVPGIDIHRLTDLFNRHSGGMLGLFNMFSGGALSRLSVFALGVMPYISASIVMQLFSVAVPYFEQLRKEGERGRRKISQYTRQGTLLLATIQGFGISKWLISQGIVPDPNAIFYVTAVITLATGTLFLMWLGEQMTERGIGNGISLLIFAGIVSRLPEAVAEVFNQVHQGQMSGFSLFVVALLVVAVTAFVVYIERAQRRIPIHYAKRQVGRKMLGGQSSHLPLKINLAGVIPPIFASAVILLPATLSGFFGQSKGWDWLVDFNLMLQPGHPLNMFLFVGAIIFFSFFYSAMMFNPRETADNLKKSGALVPGIRPGEKTSAYLDGVMTRLTLIGSLYLSLVALLPQFLIIAWHVPFYFGGTSLLIVVVVVMDFIGQIQARLMSHKYETLMKKGAGKSGSSALSLLH
jgi:preprotein translocase subunit SecY